MASLDIIGSIRAKSRSKETFEWQIPDYSSLPQDGERLYISPVFCFKDEKFAILLCPNGSPKTNNVGWVELGLIKVTDSAANNHISCTLGIRNRGKRTEYISQSCDYVFPGSTEYVYTGETDQGYWRTGELFKLSKFLKDMKEIAPYGILIICVLRESTNEMATQTKSRKKKVQETNVGDNVGRRHEDQKNANIQESWQSKISHIYDTKEFADVRFLLNGNVFKAHRLLLASRSQKFARILLGSDAPDEYIIDEETVTENGFQVLLRFVYTDILGTCDKKSITEAYRCAKYYRVETLLIKCEVEMMSWELVTEEVCKLLDWGLDIPVLKQKCLEMIRSNGRNILFSFSFLEMNLRSLSSILESEALHNVSILERIERIMQWGVHHEEDTDYAAVRKKLLEGQEQPLLGKLEIENLNLEEFAMVVSRYRGLLTPDEVLSFMKYHQNKNVSDLPRWCTRVIENVST